MFDGDIIFLIDNELMMQGVDRNAPIVIDVEDKITALSEEYTPENIYKCIMRGMNSLIGETSNTATCYLSKHAKTKEARAKYEQYVDLLSIINGEWFAVLKSC